MKKETPGSESANRGDRNRGDSHRGDSHRGDGSPLETDIVLDDSGVDDLLNYVASSVNAENDLEFLTSQSKIGKFEVERLLGSGGQAVCLLANDPDLERKVVLKLYRSGLSKLRSDQILREGRALTKIQSPYVAQCYSVDVWQDRPFLVLEYVEGDTLEATSRLAPMDFAEVETVLCQLIDALSASHEQGVLHLDLKPSNVILSKDGRAFLIDFGISSKGESREFVVGSPAYIAPENFSANGVDYRSDIYGLGGILFHLITQRDPVSGSTKSEVIHKIQRGQLDLKPLEESKFPPRFSNVCRKCLALNPKNRFQSLDEIKRAFAEGSVQPRYSGLLSKVLLAATFAILAVGIAFAIYHSPSHSPRPEGSTNDILQIAEFVVGDANSLKLENDFLVKGKLNGRTFASGIFLPDSERVELEFDKSYGLEFHSESDCYFSLLTIQFEKRGNKNVLVAYAIKSSRDSGPLTFKKELVMTSVTPAAKCEYLWLMASNQRLYPNDIATLLNHRIEIETNGGSEDDSVLSGDLRGVAGVNEEIKVSEILIPYAVLN